MGEIDYAASEGKLWVCCACGKTSEHRVEGGNGWDISCFMNALEFDKDRLVINEFGRVTEVWMPKGLDYEKQMEEYKQEITEGW